uniref:N-acetyl-gamma-glutamyl-phosphate reductase n=1 Tax=uncultured bacterium esnapd17 TaxID=1366598 RepID=S5TN57_9BACT|nr:N-acetyl-gamma-glutamyl-phosphate reductase [uncultured bacterium esnapd17]
MKAAVLGAAGYVGGELVRLLLQHPGFDLVQVTSSRLAGKPIWMAHPNLRHVRELTFTSPTELDSVDVLFAALPRGEAAQRLDELGRAARMVVDLGPDFRLHDDERIAAVYGPAPGRAEVARTFVSGLPELHRAALRDATRISVPGCMATAAILALHPLTAAGLVEGDVLVDARTGSSGSGGQPTPASHHAERSGAMRVYQPVGHRHEPEIEQACGVRARMTVTAVPRVRGVQVIVHARARQPVRRAELWQVFREAYGQEPFVRLVAQRTGVHRQPDPSFLSGTNFCDIGVDADADGRRVVVVAALDNLVKGAAGGAVQSVNVATGRPESEGLEFSGLHPA